MAKFQKGRDLWVRILRKGWFALDVATVLQERELMLTRAGNDLEAAKIYRRKLAYLTAAFRLEKYLKNKGANNSHGLLELMRTSTFKSIPLPEVA